MPPKTITLPENASLQSAKEAVERGRTDREGVLCPCCGQQATVYNRRITSAMARVLLALYRRDLTSPGAWVRIPELLGTMDGADGQGGDWAKLAFWNLVEKGAGQREDGSSRTGYARITGRGRKFAGRGIQVKQIAYVYNGELFGFDGPLVGIDDCLGKGKGFKYDEILAGVQIPADDAKAEPTADERFFEALV